MTYKLKISSMNFAAGRPLGYYLLPKGGFFQKVRFVFQISKSQKKIFQKTILSKLEIWGSEKRIALSEKKPTLDMLWTEKN